MKRNVALCLGVALVLGATHRAPAPIVEETPAPAASAKPRPKATTAPTGRSGAWTRIRRSP